MSTPQRSPYRRLEQLLAIGSFGAASVFALGIAYLLPVETYGRMMTLQAAIVVVVSIATLRTYDLSYFSVSSHRVSPGAAFRTSAAIEIGSLVVIVAAVFAIQHLAASLMPAAAAPALVLAAAALIAMGNLQGASVARLRQAGTVRAILLAEIVCVAAWIGAGAIVVAGVRDIGGLLVVASAPQALRYLVVLVAAATRRSADDHAGEATAAPLPAGRVAAFLATGQFANALKNANTSIETMLVAAFFGPVTVAMYRVARAIQGAPTAALNVLQQRSYPDLVAATGLAEKRAVRRRLSREAVLLTLAFLPVCLGVAAAFAWLKPGFAVAAFVILTGAVYLSLVPAAFQQAALAILAMAGRNAHLGLAYLCGALVLAAGGVAMLVHTQLWVLVATVILAAAVRAAIIERQAARAIEATAQSPLQERAP